MNFGQELYIQNAATQGTSTIRFRATDRPSYKQPFPYIYISKDYWRLRDRPVWMWAGISTPLPKGVPLSKAIYVVEEKVKVVKLIEQATYARLGNDEIRVKDAIKYHPIPFLYLTKAFWGGEGELEVEIIGRFRRELPGHPTSTASPVSR